MTEELEGNFGRVTGGVWSTLAGGHRTQLAAVQCHPSFRPSQSGFSIIFFELVGEDTVFGRGLVGSVRLCVGNPVGLSTLDGWFAVEKYVIDVTRHDSAVRHSATTASFGPQLWLHHLLSQL